jgi:hypothetical protein
MAAAAPTRLSPSVREALMRRFGIEELDLAQWALAPRVDRQGGATVARP